MADVGLVALAADARSYVGTTAYMPPPPEQPGSPAADIFSLGKVLYQMLTGRAAMQYPELPTLPPSDREAKVFEAINRIVLKACSKKPQDRFQSAGEINELLSQYPNVPLIEIPAGGETTLGI